MEHPNTAPFISRILIQRLVTSNPSAGYIGRVASTFVNNGRGQRGDMVAVIKAILLDQEARQAPYIVDPEFGKLREPYLRVTQLLRAFNYKVTSGVLPYDLGSTNENTLGQFPLASPTVFNFFTPDYQPQGPIGNAGLEAPEFQIQNAVFGIATPNTFYNLVNTAVGNFSLDLTAQAALPDTATLVDNVDLLLTSGTLSAATKAKVLAAVNGVTAAMVPSGSTLALTRARLAIYLVAVSPDYAIQK